MATDRLQVLLSKADAIRKLKESPYYIYENLTDMYMLAIALGADLYTKGTKLEGKKDGLILDKYLTEYDKAIMYAIVYPKLDNIQDLTNKEKVYEIAEVMADKGFDILLEQTQNSNPDTFILNSINEANILYDEALKKGLFFD